MTVRDLAVVGAGPAGMSCALTAKGLGLDVVLFEAMALGGELNTITTVSDLPGRAPVTGPDLAADLIEQLLDVDVDIEYQSVDSLERTSDGWLLNGTVTARAVVLACGTEPDLSAVPGAEALLGKGVSLCASCDAPLFRGKSVVVVGGGRDAVSEALDLVPYAESVTLLVPSGDSLVDPTGGLSGHPEIRVDLGAAVLGLDGSPVTAVRYSDGSGDRELAVEGVFPAARRKPRLVAVPELGSTAPEVDSAYCTSVFDLYAIGDLRARSSATVAAALGEGSAVAWTIAEKLRTTAADSVAV